MTDEPLFPESLSRKQTFSADSLGAVKQEFRPAISNVIAGYILALIAAAGGCFVAKWLYGEIAQANFFHMPLWAEHGMSWGVAAVVSLAILFLFALSGLLIAFMWSLRGYRVTVHEHGLMVGRNSDRQPYPWDATAEIVEHVVYERMPIVKGVAKLLVPKVTSRYYVLQCSDGQKLAFNGNTVKDLPRLAIALKNAAMRHNIPWRIVEEQG